MTKGHRWKVVLANMAIALICYVALLAIMFCIAIIGFAVMPEMQLDAFDDYAELFFQQLFSFVAALGGAYTYYLLAHDKEGIDLDRIAAAFG